MQALLVFLIIVLALFLTAFATLYILSRRRRIAEEQREENRPRVWLLTQSDGPQNFETHAMTEAQALAFLRTNFANSSLDHVDREWSVIFFRLGRVAS